MAEHADEAWQREAFPKLAEIIWQRKVIPYLQEKGFMTEVTDNVPVPESTTKKITKRARKKTAAAKPSAAAELLAALKFIMPAQRNAGTNYQTHCIINGHWCVAFDEVLTIGCKVQEDISACPHSSSLAAALAKCGETIAITQLSEAILNIKSERFKANINCVRFEDMPLSAPDPPIMAANDELKTALGAFAWLLLDNVNPAFAAFKGAVFLQSQTLVATNGMLMLEHWHGLEIPASVLIPKASAVAVSKCDKQLVAIGGSENSITFHFADESFIKTQLFKDHYPNYTAIFDATADNPAPLPLGFFEAIDAVKDFADKGFVHLKGDRIQSSRHDGIGASFDIDGVPDGFSFNPEFLKGVQPHFHNTTFANHRVKFQNGKVRGIVMGGNEPTEPVPYKPAIGGG
jgi:hypothetical protein